MAYVAYAAQIDVRFGDPVSEVLDSDIGVCPGNFARESPHLFGPGWVGIEGRLKPWRKWFRATRARPCAVFGPVLARAFSRLALILRSLVKQHLFV